MTTWDSLEAKGSLIEKKEEASTMHEADDRLVGDPMWELFPAPVDHSHLRWGRTSLLVMALACAYWLPTASVVLVCLAVSIRQFWEGHRLARSIPDKSGGRICSLFTYAWGAWRVGMTAFLLTFVVIGVCKALKEEMSERQLPPVAYVTMLLWFFGFIMSACLTAIGLLMALRSGMRVWIGQGVNEARLLLGSMLIVAFTFLVLGPFCFSLPRMGSSGNESNIRGFLITMGGVMIGGPILLLIALDRISRRVVADTPGKFGPKAAALGKWETDDAF